MEREDIAELAEELIMEADIGRELYITLEVLPTLTWEPVVDYDLKVIVLRERELDHHMIKHPLEEAVLTAFGEYGKPYRRVLEYMFKFYTPQGYPIGSAVGYRIVYTITLTPRPPEKIAEALEEAERVDIEDLYDRNPDHYRKMWHKALEAREDIARESPQLEKYLKPNIIPLKTPTGYVLEPIVEAHLPVATEELLTMLKP